MVMNTTKSMLAQKYGAKADKAVQQHAEDETRTGFQKLPGGILGGIAQLVVCKFDQYKTGDYTGDYYFRCAGVVIQPHTVQTKDGPMMVAGLQTSIMVPVCNTKNKAGDVTTQEENLSSILNHMRMLGGDEYTKGAGIDDLEALAAGLEATKDSDHPIYFKFSTSLGEATKQYPNPRVFENWHGTKGLEDYTPEVTNNVQEVAASPRQPASNGAQQPARTTGSSTATPSKPAQAPASNRGTTTPPSSRVPQQASQAQQKARTPVHQPTAANRSSVQAQEPEPELEPVQQEFDEFQDIDSLVLKANDEEDPDGAKEAQARLKGAAIASGYDEEAVDAAEDWQAVADMISSNQGDTTTEDNEVEIEEVAAPKKGDVMVMSKKNPRTKKMEDIEVEITKINTKDNTCDVKLTSDHTKVTGVDLDSLKAAV